MKIGLYSPFVADTIGGGERYLLTLAECLLLHQQVDLIIPREKAALISGLKDKLTQAFRLNLTGLKIIPGPFGRTGSAWDRWRFSRRYDVFFYMTDGSFFIPGAKKNIVHFMVPFNRPPGLGQRFKLKFWQVKSTHSYFCRRVLEKNWPMKIDWIQWGAVDTELFKPLPKKNIILNVGRFFSPQGQKHCKRQDMLVQAFRIMCDRGLKGWQLILTGSVDPGRDNRQYLQLVRRLAKGYPVIFHLNASWGQLIKDYGEAKIYWHATGYGADEAVEPEVFEHFGISTIEAMAAGAVPVVIDRGGQPEIVRPASGRLWLSPEQLIHSTNELIKNESRRQKLADRAAERVREFSRQKFCRKTAKIFSI